MEWLGFERLNRPRLWSGRYQWMSLIFQRPAGAHAEIQRKPGSLRSRLISKTPLGLAGGSPEAGPDRVGAGAGQVGAGRG
jgi:hypothetical protein